MNDKTTVDKHVENTNEYYLSPTVCFPTVVVSFTLASLEVANNMFPTYTGRLKVALESTRH